MPEGCGDVACKGVKGLHPAVAPPCQGHRRGAAPKPLRVTQWVLPRWLPGPGTCQGVGVRPWVF